MAPMPLAVLRKKCRRVICCRYSKFGFIRVLSLGKFVALIVDGLPFFPSPCSSLLHEILASLWWALVCGASLPPSPRPSPKGRGRNGACPRRVARAPSLYSGRSSLHQ